MSSFHPSRWIRFLLCAVLAAAGCASDSSSPDGSTGSLSLDLTVAGGFMIDEVMWTISGGDMDDMTGVVDTSAPGSTASVEVFGISAGIGYVIEMEATSADDEVSCKGSASFDVQAGVSTPVEVMLNCKQARTLGGVRVNGDFNICAELSKVVVSPLQTSVGNDIDLSSQAVDQEGDPIAYLWTSNSGMIADTAVANTTYTCTEATDDEVTVMVTDDGGEYCMSSWTIRVTCVPSGGGTGGTGGTGGAGGTAGEGGAGGAAGAGGTAGEGGAGGAQPVDYDEAVDGDLEFIEGVGYEVTVTLAPGTNTVSGVLGFDGADDDIDPFFLIVPDGQQIESIEFDYTTTILANPGYAGYTFYFDAISGGATIGDERVEATEVPSESREFYADLMPLGPGRYALGRPGSSRTSDMIFEVAYTWTIVVSCSTCPSSSQTTFR